MQTTGIFGVRNGFFRRAVVDGQRRENKLIHDLRGKTLALALGTFLLAWSGCARTKPARFYTLNPLKSSMEQPGRVSIEQGIIVAVGPVDIPDYLDRPQILTRSGPREIRLSEFERWAGSLEEDVSRVLAENLSALLSPDNVTVLRWGRGTPPVQAGYRVGIDVTRFEGTLGGSVILTARWLIRREEDGMVLAVRESNVKEPVGGREFDALVNAMSRALATFSREIAAGIPVR